MKKLALLLAMVAVASMAFAQPPSKIIVKYDVYSGYGEQLITALKTEWPTAIISSYNGNTWLAFQTALETGTWNVVVVEAHFYEIFRTSPFSALASWYIAKKGPLFFAYFDAGRTYDDVLETAMGVGSAVPLSMPQKAHFAWTTTHPITTGITDWRYNNPGYAIGGIRYTTSTASAVTGWTSTPQAGQAGICVANDKFSIISGYFPSLKYTGSATLWSQILKFMWSGYSPVQPASMGKIKAHFY
jgi:hypothetical protein